VPDGIDGVSLGLAREGVDSSEEGALGSTAEDWTVCHTL
jgi:hypothetical protein